MDRGGRRGVGRRSGSVRGCTRCEGDCAGTSPPASGACVRDAASVPPPPRVVSRPECEVWIGSSAQRGGFSPDWLADMRGSGNLHQNRRPPASRIPMGSEVSSPAAAIPAPVGASGGHERATSSSSFGWLGWSAEAEATPPPRSGPRSSRRERARSVPPRARGADAFEGSRETEFDRLLREHREVLGEKRVMVSRGGGGWCRGGPID